MAGIIGFGAYIPRMRLQRSAIVNAMAWLAPNLMAKAKGARSMCYWDEDSLTMAVEACRDMLGEDDDRDYVSRLYFASTTMPFADRQNAGIIARALTLRDDNIALDITGAQSAGSSALLDALTQQDMNQKQSKARSLVVASDHRLARAISPQQLDFGDGAAAFLIGADDGVARFLGSFSTANDFISHFRGAQERFDYHWEERWIRDEGLSKILPQAIKGALKQTSLNAKDIDHFIFPSTIARAQSMVAKQSGIDEKAICSPLALEMGEAGTAHALIMLAHILETAKKGEKILLAQFGSGCNVLIFEATGKKPDNQNPNNQGLGVSGHLANAKMEDNYLKFLIFNDLLEWEQGMRAEQDRKTALTTLYRHQDMILGLVGGRCTKTGVVQFPMSRISVNPNEPSVDSQEPYKFAERRATILSWSADFLSFSVAPPNHYGMIVFDEGGRLMMDITDVEQGDVESGMAVRMVFRIKDKDSKRGFTRYFWKAVPIRDKMRSQTG